MTPAFHVPGQLNSDLGPDASRQAVENDGVTWPQLYGCKPFSAYGFIGIPYLILFGPDGTILERKANIWGHRDLQEMLSRPLPALTSQDAVK